MASRKGIAVTAGILGAVTAASFLAWAIPGGNEASFVVSDHGGYLDGVGSIVGALDEDLDAELARLEAGEIRADEYAAAARATSGQMRAQMIELVSVDAPAEWLESYSAYLDALRKHDARVRETIVAAESADEGGMRRALEKAAALGEEAAELAAASRAARP